MWQKEPPESLHPGRDRVQGLRLLFDRPPVAIRRAAPGELAQQRLRIQGRARGQIVHGKELHGEQLDFFHAKQLQQLFYERIVSVID